MWSDAVNVLLVTGVEVIFEGFELFLEFLLYTVVYYKTFVFVSFKL